MSASFVTASSGRDHERAHGGKAPGGQAMERECRSRGVFLYRELAVDEGLMAL
jgi:hypothetical protein